MELSSTLTATSCSLSLSIDFGYLTPPPFGLSLHLHPLAIRAERFLNIKVHNPPFLILSYFPLICRTKDTELFGDTQRNGEYPSICVTLYRNAAFLKQTLRSPHLTLPLHAQRIKARFGFGKERTFKTTLSTA